MRCATDAQVARLNCPDRATQIAYGQRAAAQHHTIDETGRGNCHQRDLPKRGWMPAGLTHATNEVSLTSAAPTTSAGV